MADPDRMDLVPISSGSNPRTALPPISLHVFLRRSRKKDPVICSTCFPTSTVLIGVFSLASGIVRGIRLVSAAARRTGHKVGSPVRSWVLESIFLPFFWSIKVTVIRWARVILGSLCLIVRRSLSQNWMHRRVSNFVLPSLFGLSGDFVLVVVLFVGFLFLVGPLNLRVGGSIKLTALRLVGIGEAGRLESGRERGF
jgi:hypothetical protein